MTGEKKQKKETDIQKIVNYYFKTKGLELEELKESAKKMTIIYSRHVRPAKQLLELAGSFIKAKEAIKTVSVWAKSHNLDYTIETVFKRWLELDKLKPKEVVKKPFYEDLPMVWSDAKQKWFIIVDSEWKEFAGDEKQIKWKIIK